MSGAAVVNSPVATSLPWHTVFEGKCNEPLYSRLPCFWQSLSIKVQLWAFKFQIFWENQNILAHLHLFYWHYFIASNHMWKMGQILVALLEYLNFNEYYIEFIFPSERRNTEFEISASFSLLNGQFSWIFCSRLIKEAKMMLFSFINFQYFKITTLRCPKCECFVLE